jgi:2-succinyl-6-hydroxy-2,4-cyclohexadiene-1-carboxylate synthase
MAGERDAKFTDIGQRMADEIPNAKFEPIPNAGHAAHAEQPEATAILIAEWLLV